jgi:hypothetical protein
MDDSLWPWLMLAGAGALHGLNPASGWALGAVWSARRGARGTAWRALGPLAVGHVAAIGLLVITVRQGMPVDGGAVRPLAWVLLAMAAALHCSHRVPLRLREAAGPVGLALGTFVMAGLHGAGSSFVPALALCRRGVRACGEAPHDPGFVTDVTTSAAAPVRRALQPDCTCEFRRLRALRPAPHAAAATHSPAPSPCAAGRPARAAADAPSAGSSTGSP